MKQIEESKTARPVVQPLKSRKKLDSSFKRDAVALWLSSGESAREIGAESGITERHLHSWHKQHSFGEIACRETKLDFAPIYDFD
jgi:transposase-like protein